MIDSLSPLLATGDLRPRDLPKEGDTDAKVQHEFEVLLFRQMLEDLDLPGMEGQTAMFSDLIEEAIARQIVDGRGISGPVDGTGRRPPHHAHPAPAGPSGAHRSSGFGWRNDPFHGERKFHSGVDLAAPMGTPIHAARGGIVLHAGPAGGYGNLVVVDHGNGVTSRYAHCSAIEVSVGDAVAAGQRVGRVGSTGRSTGPHLHFEVRNGGIAVDPESWLNGAQGSLPPIRGESTTGEPTGGS